MGINIFRNVMQNLRSYIFWCVVVICSCLITVLSIYSIYLPEENQVMYLSSTSAQVIAALYGLTVTGYIFFDGKLKSYINEDATLQDIIDNLRGTFRNEIIIISIICFISMSFSISNIMLSSIDETKKLQGVLTLECVFYSFLAILRIMAFTIKVIKPSLIKDRSIKLQKEFKTFSGEERTENLSIFLKKYNQLESFINSIASNIVNDNKSLEINRINTFSQSLNILVSSEYISKELYEEINQIRMYRNTIIHGQDLKVSQKALDELTSILYNMQNRKVT